MREAHTEIEAETAGMSPEQVVEYYRHYPYEGPHTEIDATRLPWWGSGDRQSGGDYFDCIAYMRWARARVDWKKVAPRGR